MFSFRFILASVMLVTCLHGKDTSFTQTDCADMFNTLADIKCRLKKLENILGPDPTICASTTSPLTSGTTTTSPPTKCPENWRPFRKSCYSFNKTVSNFTMAVETCKSLNAHLVYVESADENKFLKDSIKSINPDVSWWIGLTDDETEGTWKWVGTDRVVTFKDWHTGAPDNLDGNENCAMYAWPSFDWNDAPCNYVAYIICEKEQIG